MIAGLGSFLTFTIPVYNRTAAQAVHSPGRARARDPLIVQQQQLTAPHTHTRCWTLGKGYGRVTMGEFWDAERGAKAAVWCAFFIVLWLLMQLSCEVGLPSNCTTVSGPLEVLTEFPFLIAFAVGQASAAVLLLCRVFARGACRKHTCTAVVRRVVRLCCRRVSKSHKHAVHPAPRACVHVKPAQIIDIHC